MQLRSWMRSAKSTWWSLLGGPRGTERVKKVEGCRMIENYVLTVSRWRGMWNAKNRCTFNGMKYWGEERENKSWAACVWWANTKTRKLLAWLLQGWRIFSTAERSEIWNRAVHYIPVFSIKFVRALRWTCKKWDKLSWKPILFCFFLTVGKYLVWFSVIVCDQRRKERLRWET